jgi:hypothetical protein
MAAREDSSRDPVVVELRAAFDREFGRLWREERAKQDALFVVPGRARDRSPPQRKHAPIAESRSRDQLRAYVHETSASEVARRCNVSAECIRQLTEPGSRREPTLWLARVLEDVLQISQRDWFVRSDAER